MLLPSQSAMRSGPFFLHSFRYAFCLFVVIVSVHSLFVSSVRFLPYRGTFSCLSLSRALSLSHSLARALSLSLTLSRAFLPHSLSLSLSLSLSPSFPPSLSAPSSFVSYCPSLLHSSPSFLPHSSLSRSLPFSRLISIQLFCSRETTRRGHN